ncbi:MAG: hypothetical protein KatS3mg057_1371 [Herpetosiphonaceae bacterium]|nr:MAG: hypothetical protein KatS3mg057_1371 [Herpetosiphonaceae bacterium]
MARSPTSLWFFAVTSKEAGAKGGITAFIVEKDFPGFRVGKVEEKMGLRASHTASLFFEDCRVPKENVLGQVGMGFPVAMRTLDIGRCALGASSLGSAKQAFEYALNYSVERQQFGRPICRFPGDSVQAGGNAHQDLRHGADGLSLRLAG